MRASGGPRVEVGAVLAAWDQVVVLRSEDGREAWPELLRRIAAAVALYGAREIVRGTVVLIGHALGQIGGGRPDGEELAGRYVEALLGGLSDVVEPADLPVVRQVVVVASQGRNPLVWRDGAGPIGEGEPRAMTSALVLIAEFVDRIDGPGACERRILTALGDALD